MNERLQTFGLIRAVDTEKRRVTAVVSTDAVARDGAIIEVAGWEIGHFGRNPVVLWAHDDRELPIARALETHAADHELIQVHEFATHPRAEEVWTAVRDGFVHATSVRWLPGETDVRKVNGRNVLVFTRGHQLLEVSYVPVPADPGAMVLRADGQPLDIRKYMPEPVPAGTSLAQRFLAGFTRQTGEVSK